VTLFSFQDVITAVTGIMLLVVMMLVLDVIESKFEEVGEQASSRRHALETELEKLKRQRAELTRRLRMSDAVPDESPSAIRRRIQRAQETQEALETELDQDAEILGDLEQNNKRLQAAVSDLETRLKDLTNSQRHLTARREELKRHPRVRYELEGDINKRPVLAQCGADGIAIYGRDSKEVVKSFDGPDFVDRFVRWARGQDAGGVVFFILIQPGAASYARDRVLDPLSRAGYQLGYEPLEEGRVARFQGEAQP
jgi:hypothetical protein